MKGDHSIITGVFFFFIPPLSKVSASSVYKAKDGRIRRTYAAQDFCHLQDDIL